MNNTLHEIYQKIADYIVDQIDEPFHKAWIYMEMEKDNSFYTGRFIREPGQTEKEQGYFLLRKITETLRDLWREFEDEDGVSWYSGTFTLFGTGKFEIDFNYDKPEEEPKNDESNE